MKLSTIATILQILGGCFGYIGVCCEDSLSSICLLGLGDFLINKSTGLKYALPHQSGGKLGSFGSNMIGSLHGQALCFLGFVLLIISFINWHNLFHKIKMNHKK